MGKKAIKTFNPLNVPIDYWSSLYSNWAFGDSSSAKRWRYETRDWWLIGDLNRWYDTTQKTKDYMANKNIDWADVKYPSLLDTTSTGTWNSLFSPSADVLERLYTDERRRINDERREYMDNLREEHYREGIRANQMRRAWYYSRM